MPHSQQKSDSDKWIPFKNLWVISQKSSWIAREITHREAACVPQNKCVTLNEEVICFDWHRRKKNASRLSMHMKANVCLYMQPQRRGWKAAVSSPPCPPTQRPSHQVGGRQSTLIGQLRPPVRWKQRAHGFSQPKEEDDFHLLISPHQRTTAAVMSRGWFRTENYLDINSCAIIPPLMSLRREMLKRSAENLENREWVTVSSGGPSDPSASF